MQQEFTGAQETFRQIRAVLHVAATRELLPIVVGEHLERLQRVGIPEVKLLAHEEQQGDLNVVDLP